MKLKMIKTTPGSEDGINTMLYKKGHEYEINTKLADVFIKMGVAEEEKMEKVIENKMIEPKANKISKQERITEWPKKEKAEEKKEVKKRKRIKDMK